MDFTVDLKKTLRFRLKITFTRFVRKPEYPLTQVIWRLSEVKQHIVKNTGLVCPLKKQHFVGLILSVFSVTAQYQEMYSEQWAIKVSIGDIVFIIGNNVCHTQHCQM